MLNTCNHNTHNSQAKRNARLQNTISIFGVEAIVRGYATSSQSHRHLVSRGSLITEAISHQKNALARKGSGHARARKTVLCYICHCMAIAKESGNNWSSELRLGISLFCFYFYLFFFLAINFFSDLLCSRFCSIFCSMVAS